MDIILKTEIPNLGEVNDIVTVKDGYARNYLIPKGMAVIATSSARKVVEETIRQQAFKAQRIKEEAEKLAEQIKNKEIRIGAKTSTTGKIFGSVNNIQIAEALEGKGFEIDRKRITIKGPVKEIGKYIAEVKLHREVIVELPFEVFSE